MEKSSKYATLPTPSGLSLTIENNNNAEAKTDEASVASNTSSNNDTANKENNANTVNTTNTNASTVNSPSAKTFANNPPAAAVDAKPVDRSRSNSTDSEASTASTSSLVSQAAAFFVTFGL